ncbi:mitochondrial coenzyme A diphosphatase NUDT8 [Microcaecilia unicolor]|uniref:Nucleoside diphosphate-linked moiety X motif 8 n=1 Tax=Microcaecilia unicolor TaxID=1415580 RepID=A0A6P7ZGM0_9AMPH|nr:nucleoside diphosphate-linked moiety X motif 8 [Microcaecilia unicolor]XP_030078433.1 nucleoside diphosphate-linked moiety X motif 8 [Microcaecilia unicolor]XP_030078442.1 nucleoside diphosphate-linked moiety X motif 8 [Microcaecilia unicolor]XP_030078449.1 nucleoside diphosphate-linked moiety X motif 8 [Microcaecilia unicolor]XP_030078457.1 nucleoside diphosphate-linked moiety X motif 8 [Microcaecilia unicolor]XP_030078466.1 nucleoside diphosphate-linked moiety X motif 8 [Microcaecilia uni
MLATVLRLSWRPDLTRTCATFANSPEVTAHGPAWSCLSLENEQRCRHVLEAPTAQYRDTKVSAAVLVSLCTVAGVPSFLYTLRSSTLLGSHKGEVSFPGGKCDPSDQSVIHTALRETEEELGIQVLEENVWGIMKPLTLRTEMVIVPVLANLGCKELLSLRPNRAEVEDVFTLSLPHICEKQNQGYTNFRWHGRYRYTTPVFLNGKYRIWGLTAALTDFAVKLLVPGLYRTRALDLGLHF